MDNEAEYIAVGKRMQKGTYALAHDLVVIYEKNFDWHKNLFICHCERMKWAKQSPQT